MKQAVWSARAATPQPAIRATAGGVGHHRQPAGEVLQNSPCKPEHDRRVLGSSSLLAQVAAAAVSAAPSSAAVSAAPPLA